jgi:hypothetical protein
MRVSMRFTEEVGDLAHENRRVRDAYGIALLLVLTATLMLVAAGSPLISPLAVAAALLQLGALFVTLRVSGFHRRVSRWGSYVTVGLFAVAIAGVAVVGQEARTLALVFWLLLTLVTIASIGRRLVTYKQVNIQMVMGLLVIYLLIGMTYALGYQLVDVYQPPALVPEGQGISGAIYYSFVTLATLGYGDVLPGNNLVRSMAIAEALIGQLYLVGVVSLAVSRLGSVRQVVRSEEAE